MARLIAGEALDAGATIGELTLAPVARGRETSIAPFRGRDVSGPLAALGLRFPAANAYETAGGAALLWAGRGRALLIGADVPAGLAGIAACTDQTGAQAVLQLTGPALEDVLARLVPLDLRRGAFPVGSLALSLVGHMSASIRRTEAGIEVAVMRSMGRTLVGEITHAAEHVAARAALI